MGILSIMHKLHDPFNSHLPSDPSSNGPSLLPPSLVPGCCFLTPWKSMEVLPLIFSNTNSPSPPLNSNKQTNSTSAVLPGLEGHAEDREKPRKSKIKHSLFSYCQSSVQTIVGVLHNMQRNELVCHQFH